jgi:hypothetical protein
MGRDTFSDSGSLGNPHPGGTGSGSGGAQARVSLFSTDSHPTSWWHDCRIRELLPWAGRHQDQESMLSHPRNSTPLYSYPPGYSRPPPARVLLLILQPTPQGLVLCCARCQARMQQATLSIVPHMQGPPLQMISKARGRHLCDSKSLFLLCLIHFLVTTVKKKKSSFQPQLLSTCIVHRVLSTGGPRRCLGLRR